MSQRHGVSKLFEAADVMAFDARRVEVVEVVDAELGVRLPVLQDVVNDDQ